MSLLLGQAAVEAIMVADVAARRVMVGVGNAAVEAWYAPARGEFTRDLTNIITTYATHTIIDAGTYTITYRLTTNTGSTSQIRATLDGSSFEQILGQMGSPSVITTTQTLPAGATLSFRASVALGFSANATGAWSVVKQL